MQTNYNKNQTIKLLKQKIEIIRDELYMISSRNKDFYHEDIQKKSQELDCLMNKLMTLKKESTCQ